MQKQKIFCWLLIAALTFLLSTFGYAASFPNSNVDSVRVNYASGTGVPPPAIRGIIQFTSSDSYDYEVIGRADDDGTPYARNERTGLARARNVVAFMVRPALPDSSIKQSWRLEPRGNRGITIIATLKDGAFEGQNGVARVVFKSDLFDNRRLPVRVDVFTCRLWQKIAGTGPSTTYRKHFVLEAVKTDSLYLLPGGVSLIARFYVADDDEYCNYEVNFTPHTDLLTFIKGEPRPGCEDKEPGGGEPDPASSDTTGIDEPEDSDDGGWSLGFMLDFFDFDTYFVGVGASGFKGTRGNSTLTPAAAIRFQHSSEKFSMNGLIGWNPISRSDPLGNRSDFTLAYGSEYHFNKRLSLQIWLFTAREFFTTGRYDGHFSQKDDGFAIGPAVRYKRWSLNVNLTNTESTYADEIGDTRNWGLKANLLFWWY